MSIQLRSWNVNGLRACGRSGFIKWLAAEKPDVLGLQEIKVRPEQLEPEMLNPLGYHAFWHPAEKAGYSGVAVISKREPVDVRYGLGVKEIDREGRVLTAEFRDFIFVSAYFPNSQRDHARLDFKLQFCRAFHRFCERERERGKSVVLCGDFNIAHTEIDLKNPKSNVKNAGFLPEERDWMTKFLGDGYVDCFRHFTSDPGHYTWWSYRPGIRAHNVGWRIDYFVTDPDSTGRLKSAHHQTKIMGSDHCPIALEIKG